MDAATKHHRTTEPQPNALMEYWAHGKGAAKINWGAAGDFDRCRVQLGKYVHGDQLDGLCANLHHRATGAWSGRAAGEKGKH